MALKGKAWRDARERAARLRAACGEAGAAWEEEKEPIEIDRNDAKEILEAARNFLDILSAAIKEEDCE